MRELIKIGQDVTVIPQDFNNTNKGSVIDVSQKGFKMQLKYIPKGLIINHICDFYSYTPNGYLYFESYIQELENNVITISNPIKHRFLQRRKFTRIKFLENLILTHDDKDYSVRTLDLSAGGMKIRTSEVLDINAEYRVTINLTKDLSVSCKYKLIRMEKDVNDVFTISGSFTALNKIDKMTLVQFCMKKDMERISKK